MFTVCPKCALTLVVTAQDLRVAQGYVRCGRCSNVFNAIVGLTDDRGALGSGAQSTATTSIIRKAPSISEDEPPADPLSQTGESEAIYAEPDAEEVKFQEVFTEPVARTQAPTPAPKTPPAAAGPPPAPRAPAPISFIAPPPGPPIKAPEPTAPAKKSLDAEKRYSDTEGIDTYPQDSELEFNPAVTDVTKVFVEAAPVAFKGDATGNFRKIVGGEADETPENGKSRSAGAAAPAANATPAQPSSATPAATAGAAPPSTAKSATLAPPPRDAEDLEIDSELRSLAARIGATASRPAPKFPAAAANDEAVTRAVTDEDRGIGDIYAKAVPRPREQPKRAPTQPAQVGEAVAQGVAGADTAATDSAIDTLTPAAAPPSRFMWWVAGAAVLCLVLVAQVINHNRHSLATNALLNRPLTRFYKAIGVPLVPSWDLRAYDVRQLGASTSESGEGTLTVRASLKNDAAQPLPLPLLRITMQDRYGNRVATRDVPPSGYVPGVLPPEAHLGAGQRIDAEIKFKDPGQNAVGFEIDACLATATGRIACANDTATAAR